MATLARSIHLRTARRTAVGIACLLIAVSAGCQRTPATADASKTSGSHKTVAIEPGPDFPKRLQRALIVAQPGDVVELPAGRFPLEAALSLDVDNVTLRGQGPDATVLDFSNERQGTGGEALLITAGHTTIENFAIENARGHALKVMGAKGVAIRRVRTEWTGEPKNSNGPYGIYPVSCRDVLIEDCFARGASDAGIYVGQSTNVVVRHNRATANVAGIEIENCTDADVYDNRSWDNTGGILIFSLPNLPAGNGHRCRVFQNQIEANNHPNFATAGNIVALVPPGAGLMTMAYDQVEAFENQIKNNQTANLLVLSYLIAQKKYDDANYDPYPHAIHIHHNTFAGGGDKPQGEMGSELAMLVGGKFPDIVYDGIVPPAPSTDKSSPATAATLSIHDNGSAGFVDLHLNADLLVLDSQEFLKRWVLGQLPKPGRDLAPYAAPQAALQPVKLPE